MNSKERMLTAMRGGEPDRVPVDLWMSGGLKKNLADATGASAEEFLDRHDVDLRSITKRMMKSDKGKTTASFLAGLYFSGSSSL